MTIYYLCSKLYIMRTMDIKGYEAYYTISDTGEVFSKRLGRNIKCGIAQPTGYVKVWLTDGVKGRTYSVHRLVLEHFVGVCPKGLECHHKDHDKENNYVDNLEWVTHSENILRSFRDNHRHSWWRGKKRGRYSIEHRQKMAEAKKKPILARRGDDKVDYESIQACAEAFGCYREKVYRRLKSGKDLDGWFLEYA